MKSPSLLTRIISFAILIVVAIVAAWALKVAVQIILWIVGALIVLGIVLLVAGKLRKAGRL